jgi:hypothetical protein
MNAPDIRTIPDNNSSNCFETIASADLCTCIEKYIAITVTKRKKILKRHENVHHSLLMWFLKETKSTVNG